MPFPGGEFSIASTGSAFRELRETDETHHGEREAAQEVPELVRQYEKGKAPPGIGNSGNAGFM